VLLVGVVLVPLGLACSLGDVVTSLADQLARLDCRTDVAERVSTDRTALLFAHDHVYQKPGEPDREWYDAFLNEAVPRTYDDANAYLEERSVGILFGLLNRDLTENDAMAPVAVTAGGFPQGASLDLVTAVSKAGPQFVHVHWSPSVTSVGVGGYGGGILPDAFWLGIIEGPTTRQRTADERRRTFVHEFGHMLGLEHNDMAGNFMNENTNGDSITAQQLADMWETLNARRPLWLVLSCRTDAALRPIVRDNSGDEIVTAVCKRPAASVSRTRPPRPEAAGTRAPCP
jgi:hypothetical protein